MRDILVVVAIVAAVWALAIVALLVFGRKVAARRLLTIVPNVVTLFRGLLRDDRVPVSAKLLLGVGIAWIVSPIDLVPEFVPVLGPFDDAIVAALVIRYVVRRAGPQVVAAHWHGDDATLKVLLRVAGVRPRQRNDPRLPA